MKDGTYEQAGINAEAMLKMLMHLEYMTARLDVVKDIMDSIYKPTGEQK
jgi:hypothetical protein